MKADTKFKIINPSFLLFILFFSITGSTIQAQNRWIEDRQMNFKINVPSNYQTNNLWDGTDKIYAFVSPDQNLVVRVRAIKLSQNITGTQLQSLFEQNIINGAIRITDELTDLNGLPARWSGYSWVYNNVNTVLANYYIVQAGMAYVVWSIVAENFVTQKTPEMSNIMGSFTLINGHPQNTIAQVPDVNQSSGKHNTQQQTTWNNNSYNSQTNNQSNQNTNINQPRSNTNTWQNSGNNSNSSYQNTNNQSGSSNTSSEPTESYSHLGIKVNSVKNGTEVDSNLEIISPTDIFPSDTKKIHTVFDYSGNANNLSFNVKWFSLTHKCLITEAEYLPTFQGKNHVHSYIENKGQPWPEGNYRVEIWYDGNFLTNSNFSIGKAGTAIVDTNGKLIGKCFADGHGNNQTKSLGGKYCSLELNTANDNDVFEVRVTSGKLDFVTIHYRNSRGIWYTAYKGPNTRFRVGDVLNGKRNLYTHLTINVNAEHEKYLPVACYAEVWLNPTNQQGPSNIPQQQGSNTSTNNTSSSTGKVFQIVMDNNNCGFDFKTGKVRSCHGGGDPDVMSEPWCTDNPALCGNWVKTGKSRMQDVSSAPASGYLSDGKSYIDCHECPVNEVLVFKLKDGTYGKFMIIKDDKSKVNGNCQHKITCQVEYPAFK